MLRAAAPAAALAAALAAACLFDSGGVGQGHATTTGHPTTTDHPTTTTSPTTTTAPTTTTSSPTTGPTTTSPTTTTGPGPACGEYGPDHTFAGLTASLYVTQGCCSPLCAALKCRCEPEDADDVDGAAEFFCSHFYGPHCTPLPGYSPGKASEEPILHNGYGCSGDGVDIPGTDCFGGPCKIAVGGPPSLTGIVDLVCSCADCERD